jgi:mono/diheme cytochrome c family protein
MRTTLLVVAALLSALGVVACAAATREGAGAGTGQALYRGHCASCHRLHEPGERTGAEWEAQVDRMAARAHLAGAERDSVLTYLRAHARDAQPQSGR